MKRGGEKNETEASEENEPKTTKTSTPTTRAERAVGAVLGVLVGDALGFPFQWYYDIAEKDKDHGPWVSTYVDPKPDGTHFFAYVSKYRYEQGLRGGDYSQLCEIFSLLLASVASKSKLELPDFFSRLDGLTETLSGESLSGRYTDGSVNDWRAQRLQGVAWDDPSHRTASPQTTSDGAVLCVVLAALYDEPRALAEAAQALMQPLLSDDFIRGNSVVFALAVQALINGVAVAELGPHMKKLGFDADLKRLGGGAFDNFLTPSYGAAASTPGLDQIDPKLVSSLFGPDCQLTHLLPAAYYLNHRFPFDFEQAVLAASNGAGQNVVRAALTGALAGAANGVNGIPAPLLEGLRGGEEARANAEKVAALRPDSPVPSL